LAVGSWQGSRGAGRLGCGEAWSPARDARMVGEEWRHNINSHEMKNKFYIIGKDENEVSYDYGNIFELIEMDY